jgi:hypothetical protein
VYRDETASARERLDAAVERQHAAVTDVAERLEAIATLSRQLEKKGLSALAPPEVAAAKIELEDTSTARLPELVQRADEVETDAERLEGEVATLGRVFVMLQDRLLGRETVEPLGEPPRSVPVLYVATEWLCSFWALWILPVVPVCAFWPPVGVGALGLLAVFATVRTARRAALLRWAKVAAQVKLVSSDSTSTNYTNWPMRTADGWKVTVEGYSGSGSKDVVAYMTDTGKEHQLTIRGTGYGNGVVLHHAHEPERALSIEMFHCRPRPDYRGAWRRVPGGVAVWIRTMAGIGILGAAIMALVTALSR